MFTLTLVHHIPQPFTKSGVWGFLLQSCLNLLSLLIIEHAGPQRGTHNHAKPQSGTFTNPSIMIKVIWKIDSFALALNFWMMESRPSSICRSTLSSSSKEPPFYKWDLIQLFYLMNLHLVHFKRNLKSFLSVLLAYCVLSQTWSENKSKRGNPRPNTISPIPFPKIPTWELNPGKSKRKSYKNPRSRVSVFRQKAHKRILVWLRYSMDWNFPSFNNINYSISESFTALIFSAMLLK